MNSEKNKITRRTLLRLALASPLATAILPAVNFGQIARVKQLNKQFFLNAQSKIVPVDENQDVLKLKLIRQWEGAICRSVLTNNGQNPVRVKEIILFDLAHDLPPETR